MAPLGAIANRQFLRRVVRVPGRRSGRYAVPRSRIWTAYPRQRERGRASVQPAGAVVHVDNDPIVYTHSKALLADAVTTDFVLGDVCRPGEILTDPVVRSLIDFDQPVGLLLFAILHHVEDSDHPGRIMAELRGAMPSGSYVALSSLRLPRPTCPSSARSPSRGRKCTPGSSRACGGARTVRSSPGSVTGNLFRPVWSRWGLAAAAAGNAPYPEMHQSFSGGVAKKR